ncbi:DNA-binding domain-containing protein [Flavobacterium sp. MC2016-06]|uniref:HvfC/BufC N-terminal domain-containing protein n=1 Tax=Flavobacterium sp. MC2016-06 TaxID=2676308 RepID=UPI0012BA8240|nr:DNA-binding domain-containing protein [Flavobacterium sp. MC2016-06]MBU3858900.1 DNA-binding domain-containing protein [Flavobacterium sp. MC2016-06]
MSKDVQIPLKDFQQWMQQLLLDPYQQTGIDPSNLLSNAINASSIEDVICHSEKLTAQEHLGIYQRSYIARLRNCMSQQFSALEYALGETIFCAFADDYLASRPSHNYNLSFLGAHFSEYLQNNRPDAEEEVKEDWIDFMIELAQFEYAIGVIFEEKAEENYQLATTNTPEEDLKLVPICALFKFQFPVRKYYSDFKNEKQPSLPLENETYGVVLRHKFKLAVYDLHKEQYDFLNLLKEQKDIAATKEIFKVQYKENDTLFEQVWSSWKERWIAANFFRV